MTRRIGLITLLIMSLFFSGCDLWWSRYTNQEYGFSIILPRFWKKDEGFKNTIVIARLPKASKEGVQENITITAGRLPQEAPLDILYEANKEEIMRVLPGVKDNVSEGDLFAGRDQGRWLRFDNKVGNLSLRILTGVWIKKQRVYVITCCSSTQRFSKYEPIFQRVIRSLRIK